MCCMSECVNLKRRTNQMTGDRKTLDVIGIADLLPHRYPFLLIDKIVDYTLGESITAIKNVSINEPYFQGHFPGNPILPGVLIIEAMAQAGGVLSHLTVAGSEDLPLYVLAGVTDTRFRKPVRPGDTLVIKVAVDRVKRGIWWYDCSASVDGQAVVTAKVTCAEGG